LMRSVHTLLIEDCAGDVLLMKQALAEFAVSLRFNVARDGEQALSILSEPNFKPDLIILDLNVPKITGLGFLERYRQRDIPIVVFSSSQNAVEIQRALELGACECVEKPSDLGEFRAVIRGIIVKWVGDGGAATEAAASC
jgi:DNA-binding response OmpR family regulator